MRSLLAALLLLPALACQPVKGSDDDSTVTPDATPPAPDGMMCTGDGDCGAGAPHCLNHECVECTGNADCANGELCDAQTHACRGCQQHTECDSNVCNLPTGACVASDNVVYVDSANGSFQTGCGTKQLPCRDLKAGADQLTDTRKFLSLFGSFSFYKLTPTHSTVIIGYGQTTLDYSNDTSEIGPGIHVATDIDVTVEGVTVSGNANSDGIGCEKGKVHIVRSKVVQNSENGVNAAAGCALEIFNSDILGNKGYGVLANQLLLRNSLVAGNQRGGISTCSDGVDIRNNVIRNNSSVQNYDGALEMFCGTGATPGIVAFNTFVGNGINGLERGLIACEGQPNLVVDSNIIFGNTVGSGDTVTSCPGLGKSVSDQHLNLSTIQTSDPGFVDPANADLHLKPTSPAKDQGTPANALPLDKDGVARDGMPDIGAFEAH